MTDEEHYKSLNKKPGSAGILLVEGESVLLVNPVYKEGWEIPGGAYELNESPIETLHREVHEELGIRTNLLGLAGIDYLHKVEPHRGDSLNFIFWAEFTEGQSLRDIVVPPDELKEAKFIPFAEVRSTLAPYVRDRVETILQARAQGHLGPVYMEDGKQIF